MDIDALLSSLGEEDVKKLKETAARFFGGEETAASVKPEPVMNGSDAALIKSVAKLSSFMNMQDDRCDFLMSMKPLLSEKRRKKADEAVMLLKVFRLLSQVRTEDANG